MMGSGLPLNRVMSRCIRMQSYSVECGLRVKTLWKKVSRVKGGWGLHTIRQLHWQEVGQLCPHIPSTDVWQGKYFHSWRGKGGKLCFTSQWKWWKPKVKLHLFDRMLFESNPTPPQSWSWEMSSDDQLLSTRSLGLCPLFVSHGLV